MLGYLRCWQDAFALPHLSAACEREQLLVLPMTEHFVWAIAVI